MYHKLHFVALAVFFGIFHSSALRAAETPLDVVATTGMVADLVREVGGERVRVTSLMAPGVDPHLYKPTSRDAAALSGADAIFYNGLMLEGRMNDLFERLAAQGRPVFAISDALPKDRLHRPQGYEGHYDPHIWFDVALWADTVPEVVRGLSQADPAGKAVYEAQGQAVRDRLLTLDAWCREQAAQIPEHRRVLVTSHDAYGYFGAAYGFRVVGLQGVSTISEAALADVSSLITFLREQRVPAIFVESSVNPAALQRVSAESGVVIGGELYSDAMGAEGEKKEGFDVGTYEGMVRYNMTTIAKALGGSAAPRE